MKVKTYKTQSLEEGLESIKRDLGNEALILSTRSVKVRPPYGFFKKASWEITAALDDRAQEQTAALRTGTAVAEQRSSAPVTSRAATDRRYSGAAAAVAPAPEKPKVVVQRDTRMDDIIGEISDLKKSLRSLSHALPSKTQDFGGGLFAEMITSGISQELADHLITTAAKGKPTPSELRDRVRRLLSDQLVVVPPAELNAKARIVSVFVGPTGVGKTTTIAKIAGHASVRLKKKVALISTDMFRVGGQEQLSRFGELLGIPAYGCADISTLKSVVASLDDRDLVLIDTAGSSPSDLSRLSKLENVISSAGAKVHLVMSATTRSEDIAKIVSRFGRFSPASAIITKIDETDAKGSFVGDLLRNELVVSYLTNGQRVPEDLLIPSAPELARFVLPQEPAI
ncbi:MAG TPA: flagellar biosynthesis protein FlhF [Terriglobia bacterium]|nr:flagellar biosynthesis protein FlhF [Terriglobia bacterium]